MREAVVIRKVCGWDGAAVVVVGQVEVGVGFAVDGVDLSFGEEEERWCCEGRGGQAETAEDEGGELHCCCSFEVGRDLRLWIGGWERRVSWTFGPFFFSFIDGGVRFHVMNVGVIFLLLT